MKRVLVCKGRLLGFSETFIRDQILSCSSWHPVLVGFERIDGLDLRGLDVRILGAGASRSAGRWLRKVCSELNVPPPGSVARLRCENASLVHIHFGTEILNFWPIARRLQLPVLVTLHGADINIHPRSWERGWVRLGDRRYPRRLKRMAADPAVHFIAVSEAIRQRALDYGIPAERLSVRYIGIDLGRFRPDGPPISTRPNRLLFVGRFVEKKGGEYLLQAFARLRQRFPDLQLAMAGDGPLWSEQRRLAQSLGVPVEFPGRLTSEQIRAELNRARIFCLPSITAGNGDAEGLPISILEAQACGVPVITSARGGATEGIEPGVTGLAFPEKDIEALTHSIESLLRDPARMDRMSAAAASFAARRFNIQACTRQLESLYDEVSAGGSRSGICGARRIACQGESKEALR